MSDYYVCDCPACKQRKTWEHRLEMANDGWAVGEAENIKLKARVAKLEAALYPIGKLGYDQTPRQLGMSVKALSRIRVLTANSEVAK